MATRETDAERVSPTPGGLVRIGDDFWEVRSCLLGATKQEDVIEVRRIGYAAPNDVDGFPTLSHVPRLMIRALVMSRGAKLYPPPT